MEGLSIVLEHGSNCSVEINMYGATVTSWICNGNEQLFLSSTSKMDGSKAIRGGIPIVFPNFGPWSNGPQHGFARISTWKVVEEPRKIENGDVVVVLELIDDDTTRKMWNYSFSLQYKVTLGEDSLTTELKVNNTGSCQFDFTTLLHTYFRLSDISKCTISGFDGCLYTDKVQGTDNNRETSKEVSIDCNVDRVYKLAGYSEGHKIATPGCCIHVQKTNLPDTVLWNPWIEKAASMSDFDNEGYLNMVCVEPGYVSERKVLEDGQTFTCSQKLTVL